MSSTPWLQGLNMVEERNDKEEEKQKGVSDA